MFKSIGTFLTEEALNDEFYVYECGFEDVLPREPYQYQPIDYYLIHYIEKGEGLFFINDEVQHLKKGQGFIIPPNTKNNYYPLVGNPWSYRWVGFRGTKCQALFQKCGLLLEEQSGIENYIFNYEDQAHISEVFKRIYEFSNDSMPYKALGEAYYLMHDLMLAHQESLRYHVTSAEHYIQDAMQLINQQFNQPDFTVEALADTLQIERSYLYRLFKKYLDLSPKHYLIQTRIRKSAELLQKSNYPIEEIAYMIGFNNPSHFSRQFTKVRGISPSKYRGQFKLMK